MKTQIIVLESHDDLISVRDRLSWAKTPRILLVWPKGEPVDLRAVDLRVLQRHADSLGAQLAVVSRGFSIRRQAEALGLPVFESSAAAQREAWPAHPVRMRRVLRPPRRDLRTLRGEAIPAEAGWRSNLLARILTFTLGVMGVLAIVSIFVPRASIILYPESRVQSLTVPVSAAIVSEPGPAVGMVPAHEEKVVLTGTWKMDVSGHMLTLPQTTARGVVRFRNLSQEEVEIPAGTVVFAPASPEIRFRTLNLTHLAAGVDEIAEVPVEALQAGAMGNLEAGTLQAIDGPMGLLAAVDNLEPITGGSDQEVSGPNEGDRSQAIKLLTASLLPTAEATLRERLQADQMLLEDTGSALRVVDANFDPPPGGTGPVLTLEARVEFGYRIISTTDLERLAASALNAGLPEGFQPANDLLSYSQVAVPRTDAEGVTRWQMRVERRLLRSPDIASIPGMLGWQSPAKAASILSGFSKWEKQPEIVITPHWWPWMPILPFRSTITVR